MVLLVAVGTLAIVGILLWRLHADPSRRDEIPPDLPSMAVGFGAQQVLDRASRLDGPELRQLERGFGRLDRFWSGGPGERLLEVAAGFAQLLQPTGGTSGSAPLLRTVRFRATDVVGHAREQALLARAATAIEHATARAGLQPSPGLARAVADAAIAADAGDRLRADDRTLLAWPWRDAVEHRSTIPDPGTVVPVRLTAVVGVVAAVLAMAAAAGGAPPASALAVYAVLGAFVVLAASLFRLMVWRPILRTPAVPPGLGGDARAAPTTTRRDEPAPDLGPPTPALAGATSAAADLPALLLGALVVVAPAILVVLSSSPEKDPETERTLLLAALLAASPAFVAGISGSRSARGAVHTLAWVTAGFAATLVVGLAIMAATIDPAGEMWPWLAIGAPLLLGPPALFGYGAGVLLVKIARRLRA